MTAARIRRAETGDAAVLLAIYAPIVRDTAISFETTAPGEAEFAGRIAASNAHHAWLLAERDGVIAGYAYATAYRARQAYRYSAEVSVYVHEQARGTGVGSALYRELFAVLAGLGYFQAYAAITLPNPQSVGLHRRVGFRRVGTLPRVGFKFGAWHDVSWWHRPLQRGRPEATAP
ncbi:MAG: N-acetyltransferase family protein [Pseudomonadales bacterium]